MSSDARDSNTDAGNGAPGLENGEYVNHLERSRTVWDRWSDWYEMSENDLEPMRETAIDHLELRPGDRVLDIGCGPGVNFERIRSDIGETGTLVAVDYSPEMVAKARQRIEDHGWENVEVRRADATTIDFEDEFDAAIATLSMSVMPDVRRTVENVHRSLVSGGPFVVFDIRAVPTGPARIVNPLLWRFLRWYANWNPDGDVVDSLAAVFEESELVETYFAGVTYTVRCRKATSEGS
ncbi:class I SAM-dependent methyltransferase [Natronoglomus mannanivorans]|uniref:Class I SAM-dependent methyltransferase n=1 Tax=Natronoglomus mannanivorans TaxID=2979990 RepID=A0AAP2Z375_9EURY|nr:class I SAM-dependent methyltransferase [Halobacteria archaeon AArc-xg1-1]